MKNIIKISVILLCAIIFISKSASACNFVTKKELRKQLATHSLVVVKNGEMKFYEGRGIKPLINYLDKGTFEGAYVWDKRIGKASALLLVYGKVKKVYTPIISKPAIKVFEDNNVKYSADMVVENIKNRAGTGLCPMEMKVQNINDPKAAYELFKKL